MKNKNLALCSMFVAIILLSVMYTHIPFLNGYVHIGDAVIYLAATLLPAKYAFISAGLGAALADVLSGYLLYSPFTFVIKGVMTIFFSKKAERLFSYHNLLASVFAMFVNVLGYLICEIIIYNQESLVATIITSSRTIPGNFLQSVASTLIYIPLVIICQKTNLRKFLK